jgi:starch-binding outer membrane protein, SusD/RagB family
MKIFNIKNSFFFLPGVAMMLSVSCKKDFTDPGRATEDQVFTTPKGLTGVAVGLQRIYSAGRASSLYNIVSIDGLLTRQDTLLNAGNLPEAQLTAGGNAVDGTNTMLAGLWTSSNKIIYDADLVIANAKNLGDKGFASGLIAYASIFKALSIGNMSMLWEKVPNGTGNNVTFIDRVAGFNKAITVINDAQAAITANPIPATFAPNIPAGIDIANTLNALKARYSLFAGNYTQALAAANAVDLTKKSTLNADAANLNCIFETSASNFNVYQALDSTLGLPIGVRPALTDKRVPFYVGLSGVAAYRWVIKGFGATGTTAFPIYLPGEMTLIKAEAYARQATPDLTNALIELNKVVTKLPASDPFGVGADQPLLTGSYTPAQLLDLIYSHRSIETYMSGMRLEDMRRFGRPISERRRNLMPYPFRERDNNPNTPADPPF